MPSPSASWVAAALPAFAQATSTPAIASTALRVPQAIALGTGDVAIAPITTATTSRIPSSSAAV